MAWTFTSLVARSFSMKRTRVGDDADAGFLQDFVAETFEGESAIEAMQPKLLTQRPFGINDRGHTERVYARVT
jgi:hypothetical protein